MKETLEYRDLENRRLVKTTLILTNAILALGWLHLVAYTITSVVGFIQGIL